MEVNNVAALKRAIEEMTTQQGITNDRLNDILDAFKSWQAQDEKYHNRAEKILGGRK